MPLPASLEWHVWSSSSGNNCHTVQRSLSSGASVYECIMGFYLVPFRQPSPPTRFLHITAIGMCHFLPVHHFGMACLAGSKVNIQHRSLSLHNRYSPMEEPGSIWLRTSDIAAVTGPKLKTSVILLQTGCKQRFLKIHLLKPSHFFIVWNRQKARRKTQSRQYCS